MWCVFAATLTAPQKMYFITRKVCTNNYKEINLMIRYKIQANDLFVCCTAQEY